MQNLSRSAWSPAPSPSRVGSARLIAVQSSPQTSDLGEDEARASMGAVRRLSVDAADIVADDGFETVSPMPDAICSTPSMRRASLGALPVSSPHAQTPSRPSRPSLRTTASSQSPPSLLAVPPSQSRSGLWSPSALPSPWQTPRMSAGSVLAGTSTPRMAWPQHTDGDVHTATVLSPLRVAGLRPHGARLPPLHRVDGEQAALVDYAAVAPDHDDHSRSEQVSHGIRPRALFEDAPRPAPQHAVPARTPAPTGAKAGAWDMLHVRLTASVGVLWPPFSSLIAVYDLVVPAECTSVTFTPDNSADVEVRVNFRAPYVSVPLTDATTQITVTLQPREGSASTRQAYTVNVRKRCSPPHTPTQCVLCHQDSADDAHTSRRLHAMLPFVQLYECVAGFAAARDGELSCCVGDTVACAVLGGTWLYGTIVDVRGDGVLSTQLESTDSRLFASGWLPAACLRPVPVPDVAVAGAMPRGQATQCSYLATMRRTPGSPQRTVAVVTLAGPQCRHFWATPVAVRADTALVAVGPAAWVPAADLDFTGELVYVRTASSAASAAAVTRLWTLDPALFAASRSLVARSAMGDLDQDMFNFVAGRLVRAPASVPLPHPAEAPHFEPLGVSVDDVPATPPRVEMSKLSVLTASDVNIGSPARATVFDPAPPHRLLPRMRRPSKVGPELVAKDAPAAVEAEIPVHTPHRLLFTPAIIFVQLVLLILALSSGGVRPTANPLLGPASDTLRGLGARWLPAIRAGRIHLLVTPLFVPTGIVEFVLLTLLHLCTCWPVEVVLGAPRTAFIYFAAGIVSHIIGASFVPRWVIAGSGGALFGIAGAAAWLAWRRVSYPRLCADMPGGSADTMDRAHENEAVAELAIPRVMSTRRTAANYVLLVCVLVLGALPGSDNWTHVAGFLPGLLATVCVDNLLVPTHRLREFGVLRVATAGLLAMLVLTSVVIMVYVTEFTRPCLWCMRATCYNSHSWCDSDNRF